MGASGSSFVENSQAHPRGSPLLPRKAPPTRSATGALSTPPRQAFDWRRPVRAAAPGSLAGFPVQCRTSAAICLEALGKGPIMLWLRYLLWGLARCVLALRYRRRVHGLDQAHALKGPVL